MAINILVIDDDVKTVERIMHTLVRADSNSTIGDIIVDDSIAKESTDIEEYDPENAFQTHFDIVLIDYQLGCSFTGILVSAWIALKMNIPRLTLTTAPYNGDPGYFNGSILKRDITDHPAIVLKQLEEHIRNYDSIKWLNDQYKLLVQEYQRITDNELGSTKEQRESIEQLLDKFERIIDSKQESVLKELSIIENDSSELSKKLQENREKISGLNKQLDAYLEELKRNV